MEYSRHFCRLVTSIELTDEEIIDYFDIVQSIVPVKLVTAMTDDEETVSIQVTEYTSDNDTFIYEITLSEQLDINEGEQIADMIAEEFDFDFEFETSLNIEE